MKLLFLGGKRFYGNKLLNELIKLKKFNIYVLHRGKKPIIEKKNKVIFIKCERNNEKEIFSKLNKKKFDIVYDNNCYSLENCKKIIKNLKYKNYIYIFTSTVMTLIYNDVKKVYFPKDSILKLSSKIEKYFKQKSDIENYLMSSNIKYIIFRMHNLIGENDHSEKTNFLFNLSAKDIRKYNIKMNDKIQFAFIKDAVQIILKKILKINFKKFQNKCLTIANKPFHLNEIITQISTITKKKYPIKKNDKNFKDFPFLLNYIVKKSEIKNQKHSSIKKGFNF